MVEALTLLLLLVPPTVFTLSLLLTHFWGAIWSPTPKKEIREMLRLVELKSGEILYDLGCGDGRIALVATREFGAKAIGVEINPFLWLIAKARSLRTRGVEIRYGNFYRQNLTDADVIALYLSPKANQKLAEIIRRLPKPIRVVSYRWEMPFEVWRRRGPVYAYKLRGT